MGDKIEDGSSELLTAISNLNKAYAREIEERIAQGALLGDDAFFKKYIDLIGYSQKIKALIAAPVKKRSTNSEGPEEENPEDETELDSADSFFEQTQKRMIAKNNGG